MLSLLGRIGIEKAMRMRALAFPARSRCNRIPFGAPEDSALHGSLRGWVENRLFVGRARTEAGRQNWTFLRRQAL